MPRDKDLEKLMTDWDYRSDKLREAAEIIASVVETLDTSGHVCAECKATRRKNWIEYQAAATLKHLPAKLHDQASRLSDLGDLRTR
jgi:hypothetical protein